MRKVITYITTLALVLGLASCESLFNDAEPNGQPDTTDNLSQVDPFIGTAEHGHTYPGATVPFGMVQLSPDNGTQGWDWCSGYNYIDSTIIGFSHTHLSGTGIGDLCDILVMPTTGTVDFEQKVSDPKAYPFATTFDHANENAAPGYYSVAMNNGIEVELTASTRVGFHQYSFPENTTPSFVMDLGHHINWDHPVATQITIENDTLITGYRHSRGWARNQKLFYAMALSQPLEHYTLADSTALKEGREVQGQYTKGQFFFTPLTPGEQLKLKVALSSASVEGARQALSEIPEWNFAKAQNNAAAVWSKELGKVAVKSPNEEITRNFYTALYHSNLAPVIYADALGQYKGAGHQIQEANDYERYDIFSLWDTFRAAHPLFTLLQRDRVDDMVQSIIAHYEESGLLPVWSLLGNETNTMTGYHAVPVLADAYAKGLTNADPEKLFEAMKKSAMQDIRGTDYYREYGYIPYEKEGESVTKTLEYAYDDWCIAQTAKAMGKQKEYERFKQRAASYRAMFDPSTGFMRAKLSDGTWKTPFDPQFSDHNFDVAEYTEGNAWQHSWFVPHDVQGLINLHGSKESFVQKLDSLFSIDSEIKGENASADISGLIGQYAHGNEPSHHIAYLYNYAGQPWKTQKQVREILETQYNTTPAGLCGNEDCGQMSAWYVFSALGFYPVNPADGNYIIGTPLFEQAIIDLGNGKQFNITANQVSADNFYIQSAKLNGAPLERCYITHKEIMEGGKLEFEMGPEPNRELWTNQTAFPPSMSSKM